MATVRGPGRIVLQGPTSASGAEAIPSWPHHASLGFALGLVKLLATLAAAALAILVLIPVVVAAAASGM
jgi:hypothetical protein